LAGPEKHVFLGTRANLKIQNRRHNRHSAMLAIYMGRRVMVDCGADWLRAMARHQGLEAAFAFDGMEIVIR